jgi:branched-chain amino acid transport system II carrier protein
MGKHKLDTKQVIISGFALFAIFFGAGNLIIPPYLGLHSGKGWFLASLGFNLSDSFLILLAILAMSKRGADPKKFGEKISPNFGLTINLICITLVGPLLSIPRTGATIFEVAIVPFIPNFNNVLFSLIFFIVVYIITINGSKVIDRVGKYLTPILLIILVILIISGISAPNVELDTIKASRFSDGFIEGYQTMDSLGPIFLTALILEDFKNKGFKSDEDLMEASIYAGIIAVLGLSIVYTGLSYLGAKSSSFVDPSISRTSLLLALTKNYLGKMGQIVLSLVVGLACITTAVGLLSAFASSFSKNLGYKLSYKFYVRIGVIIGFVLSILGVEKIMEISIPILLFIYPIVISLYILNLIDKGNMDPIIYKIVVCAVTLVSTSDSLKVLHINNFYTEIVEKLPLASYGFSFVFIFIISFILANIISKLKRY